MSEMKMRARVSETTRIEWNGSATFNVWQGMENVGCFMNFNVTSVPEAREVAEAWWVENKEDYEM